jgi:hypothetical protein
VDFFDRLKNAVPFAPQCGAKVRAARAASLALQDLAGHSIQFEAGFAPSSSPLISFHLPFAKGFSAAALILEGRRRFSPP